MKTDALVVGGGMVGSALAAALAVRGWQVTVVEARARQPRLPEHGFAPRVSAISPLSAAILDALGAWSRLDAERIGVYRDMRVWQQGSGEVHFAAADLGLRALGWIVENDALQLALEARLAEFDNVSWRRPAAIESLAVGPRGVSVVAGGERLRAALVVGADGADSRVRELAGLRTWRYAYAQRAVVTTVRPASGHHATAWQRFLDTGPLAFLPLPDDHCSIVWSTSPAHAEQLLAIDRARFEAAVEEAFEGRLGAVRCADPRAAFTLRRIHAREYVAERVALVGDAAHAIHPLAGQGVNLGLLDAAVLAEVLGAAATRGRNPASRATLRRYERARKGHNLAVGEAMSALRWGFAPGGAATVLRGAGMSLLDRVAPLKRILAQGACGLLGDPPEMAAGAAEIDVPPRPSGG